jgi:transaldolase/glucose-6-phosphate isomerase
MLRSTRQGAASVTKLDDLAELGQAIWIDYIRRSFVTSDDLQTLIDEGLRGVTSNPTIFQKAIAGSTDYDDALRRLVAEGKEPQEIYEALVLEDIGRAADLLRPVYERTAGLDGYVSLEARPELAHDTQGTISEVRHLFSALNRPNVMIKVPATAEGIPAIETLVGEGISVNVTLMFSLSQYEAVAEAYVSGLEKLAVKGKNLKSVASVASFFVSRVDTAVDRSLDEIGEKELQGKIAIANAKAAYGLFREKFQGSRWQALPAQGTRVQRPLWASTSTKNLLYPDTLYVDSLIGPDTVNTLPLETLMAFVDHGVVAPTVEREMDTAEARLARLAELGISLDEITDRVLVEGVAAFAKSFDDLIESIVDKCQELASGRVFQEASLESYADKVDSTLKELRRQNVIKRIWAHDHTVWKPEPGEISNRLGWLTIPEMMTNNLDRLEGLIQTVSSKAYSRALLLGMGGSSLAPQVFSETSGLLDGVVDLEIVDSTDPGFVLAHAERLDPARTLFIVSSKSGTTLETVSLFKYFYNLMADEVSVEHAGEHFVAITDPGSPLADMAEKCRFQTVFLNDPNIGGRYSALSYFGLVPAALVGVDVGPLLDRALTGQASCAACVHGEDNSGAWLGAILGELANQGRDKLTIVPSPPISTFGDWLEQLIAESTGKEGRAIVPVVGEPLGRPEVYGDDRLFVRLRLEGDESHHESLAALESAGHPLLALHLRDVYDLGGQLFLWEMATAVAGHLIGINPFNQPNVEASKKRAREMVETYVDTGALPTGTPWPPKAAVLEEFLSQAEPHDYVSLQAYVDPTDEIARALQALRVTLRDRSRLATTVGYGPRFLHSTGQLHKGDAGHGLFVQFTADDQRDVPIPDKAGSPESSITFGTLKSAQALGDRKALRERGRRVIHFHLGTDAAGAIDRLTEGLS